jgi:hypothetical protein
MWEMNCLGWAGSGPGGGGFSVKVQRPSLGRHTLLCNALVCGATLPSLRPHRATLADMPRRILPRYTAVCNAPVSGAAENGYFREILSPGVHFSNFFRVRVIFVKIAHMYPCHRT